MKELPFMIFEISPFEFILIHLLYISWVEIFCTIYIKVSYMPVYSYKHSLDLSSRFNAFMHSLLNIRFRSRYFIKVGDYFYHAPESTYMVCNANGLVISYFFSYFFSSSGSSPRL